MKNIHVLPTEKPSRLWINNLLQGKLELSKEVLIGSNTSQHIYITSDEEIKEGDWCIVTPFGADKFAKVVRFKKENGTIYNLECKKIILTTDQYLIRDGVQAIDDEFLEWFVKNPSCEEVEINYEIYKKGVGLITSDWRMSKDDKYKIVIPKEEPKQETLEEVAQRIFNGFGDITKPSAIKRALELVKWQQQQMYSEEELLAFGKSCFYKGFEKAEKDDANCYRAFREEIGSLVEQFKNK